MVGQDRVMLRSAGRLGG
ncbi:Protein of unknown function [Pyronema omphalodes CBS 100304]|uniref:Uncharacterized protein n=1 Tax=Pyronema omphalodes (strain CBS 100304) TaxID=1076935 RepID=U4L9Q4_PYROM|nr:Protein of unknown function [Pyronema omphalodes CBS 100304]